jgi:hypothetical protein
VPGNRFLLAAAPTSRLWFVFLRGWNNDGFDLTYRISLVFILM